MVAVLSLQTAVRPTEDPARLPDDKLLFFPQTTALRDLAFTTFQSIQSPGPGIPASSMGSGPKRSLGVSSASGLHSPRAA